jgi:hypothetical protein
MFEVVPGKMVSARIYSARYDNSLFKMTVVDGRDAGLPETPVIDQALKRLTQDGELKINIPHRIYRIYGRQLSVARGDGSLTTAAVFFANDRLYQIESTKFAGGSGAEGHSVPPVAHIRPQRREPHISADASHSRVLSGH